MVKGYIRMSYFLGMIVSALCTCFSFYGLYLGNEDMIMLGVIGTLSGFMLTTLSLSIGEQDG